MTARTRKPAAKAKTKAKPAAAATKKPARKKPAAKTTVKVVAPAAGRAPRKASAKRSRAPRPKGTEALYSGTVFRSRLEARWAILFDLLEINWDYEPSHYQVGPELYYLPDFYLPEHALWVEVKGPAFMDAQSMAKCLAAVAGPMPVPLREAPYTAADRLLLAGPLHPKASTMPLHTVVTKAGPGKAGLSYATFDRGGVHPFDGFWDTQDATGIPRARRPVPSKVSALLEPEPRFGVTDAEVHTAYRIAAGIGFDDATRKLSTTTARTVMAALDRRRSGRPLGPFPAALSRAA